MIVAAQGRSFYKAQSDQFFTPTTDCVVYDSPPSLSISSNRSPFSQRCSESYMYDLHHSSDISCGSSFSGCLGVDDADLRHVMRELENKLLGPECDIDDSCSCSYSDVVSKLSSLTRWNQVLDVFPSLNLKELLMPVLKQERHNLSKKCYLLMDYARLSPVGESMLQQPLSQSNE